METKILQCNLNRSRSAQNILSQHMNEFGVGWCAVSEPAGLSGAWFKSRDGLAAIYPNRKFLHGPYTLCKVPTLWPLGSGVLY